MNVLIDIGHPAHVHLMRHIAKELENHGHKIYYAVADIPVAKRLMDYYGMPYFDLGKKKDSIFGKGMKVLSSDWKFIKLCHKYKIDMALNSGVSLSHATKLFKAKAIIFDDDDDAVEPLMVKFGHPFANVTMTPNAIRRKTKNAIYYNGTHELAYLHPNRFKPDPDVLKKAGLKEGEKFFVMRFVAFKGHHDIGQRGLSMDEKRLLLETLKKHGRVIITSERQIEPEFEEYRVPVPPEDIHSLMAYASMFVGDSQTMTTEAALLGVPALKCNTFAGRLSVPNMIEEYGLSYSYQPEDFDKMMAKVNELLETPDLDKVWAKKREEFLKEMIDPTAFFVWFIENYPESKKIMKENPEYQNRFK